jgi:hypothetical protein
VPHIDPVDLDRPGGDVVQEFIRQALRLRTNLTDVTLDA